MKVLLFKISSCHTCKRQEEIFKKSGIDYIPCELFKNRDLARRYGVTDAPTTVIVDSENMLLKRYNFLISTENAEKIRSFLQKI